MHIVLRNGLVAHGRRSIVDVAAWLQVPHRAIGTARRMMVPRSSSQADIMLQALTNHNPDAIVVDELSTSSDVRAAQAISQRGVSLVATAHGSTISALLANKELNRLLGGIHEVILSDAALRQLDRGGGRGAFARGRDAKTRQERRGTPVFTQAVELRSPQEWRIHWDVATSVDALLEGRAPPVEHRAVIDGVLHSNGVPMR